MAFGFLIEKFDLFLRLMAVRAAGGDPHLQPSVAAEVIGLALFVIGAFIIAAATVRFFVHRAAIDAEEPVPYGVHKTNVLLSVLLLGIALFLIFYLAHRIAD
jgi:putative membrane protein